MSDKKKIHPAVSRRLALWGSKGGKLASHEDKVRAGKAGHAALMRKILAEEAKAEADGALREEVPAEPTQPTTETNNQTTP